MTLNELKIFCAAYHQKTVAELTTLDTDMFLLAANAQRKNAELLHNFEYSKIRASLSIDSVSGAALSTAVIENNTTSSVTVTGTLTPNATGTYYRVGYLNGYGLYIQYTSSGSTYALWYSTAEDKWAITTIANLSNESVVSGGSLSWTRSTTSTNPAGTFGAGDSYSGTATVTAANAQWASIKEITNLTGLRSNGEYVPLDFTRSDISIERDRTELEFVDDYWPSTRYPSDAMRLSRGGSASIVQRGSSLYIYPQTTDTSETPLSVTIEAYGFLSDYTSANLSDAEPTDFLLQYGYDYMKWACVCELNYLFQTFVPRQEGVLSPPEAKRQEAWRNLILWDSFMVDANSTRSR